jgi:uncharacterized protein involved in copper resistance
VKFLRIWLLVLLAVLLPVRGALAAAMVCAPSGGASAPVTAHGDHDAHHGDAGGGHEHAVADHGNGHDPAHADQTDTCNLCSASCSATPLLHDVPGIAEPYGLTSATYPDVAAAAPTFLSDGQERPPRSI